MRPLDSTSPRGVASALAAYEEDLLPFALRMFEADAFGPMPKTHLAVGSVYETLIFPQDRLNLANRAQLK